MPTVAFLLSKYVFGIVQSHKTLFWMCPQQMCLIHTAGDGLVVAGLVNCKRLTNFVPDNTKRHTFCHFSADLFVDSNILKVADDGGSNLTDFATQSPSPYMLATYSTYKTGRIVLYDSRQQSMVNGKAHARAIVTVQEDSPLSRCILLPSTSRRDVGTKGLTPCFLTASEKNAVVTLWSPFTEDLKEPVKLQCFGRENPSPSYLLDVCSICDESDPTPPPFIVMADRSKSEILAWHIKTSLDEVTGRYFIEGCDYVVQLAANVPTLSWHVHASSPTEEDELYNQEDSTGQSFSDLKFLCFQSSGLNWLSCPWRALRPSVNPWTADSPRVRAEKLSQQQLQDNNRLEPEDDFLAYDLEEYDAEDDDNNFDEADFVAPDPSFLPPPQGFTSPATPASFSTWLGNLAASKSSSETPPPPSALPKLQLVESTPTSNFAQPAGASPDTPSILEHFSAPAGPIPLASSLEDEPEEHYSLRTQPFALPHDVSSTPTGAPSGNGLDEALLRRIVKEEIQQTVPGIVQESVQTAVQDSLRPIQDSLAGRSKTTAEVDPVQLSSTLLPTLDSSLQTAVANSLRTAILPATESLMAEVLVQVSSRLESPETQQNSNNAVVAHLQKMTEVIGKLANEVRTLKTAMAQNLQQPPSPALNSPQPLINEEEKNIMIKLAEENKFYEAFQIAFKGKDPRLTLAVCAAGSAKKMFSDDGPKVSHIYLAMILQHLGACIQDSTDESKLDVMIEWIPELAFSFDPPDQKVRGILQQILPNLSSILEARVNKGVRKRDYQRLLHSIRGIKVV